MSEYRDYIVRISADGESPREKLVEIVRCRDCKHFMSNNRCNLQDDYNEFHWLDVESDGFCAWGVRRDG